MKYNRKKDHSFWKLARSFLHEYMPLVRNLSDKTIESYKISIKLYLRFINKEKHIINDKITFEIFSRENMTDYIIWLKNNQASPKTINLRMTALKSFLKYASEEDFELTVFYNNAKSIRGQKTIKKPIEYLKPEATKAILSAYGNDTKKHRRNQVLLILMYDSGCRVQELSDLKVSSLHLDVSSPYITVIWKGKKLRNVPLTTKTVCHLKKYLDEFHDKSIDEYLFYSNLDNKPHQLSTDSIALILKQAVKIAREKNESVPKKVHCHMIRKTKAMDLYKNGVPLPFIMQLLGHESMSTTTGFYAFATLEMMSEALNKTFGETKGEKLWKKSIKVKDPYSLD